MVTFPIIPIWIMIIICSFLIIVCFKNKKNSILRITMIVLIFIINLRIMIPSNSRETLSSDLDVLFVIDNTISMNALDYNNNQTRLSGVKKDCEYIINELSGARFSVISFDNKAKILVPFTYDSNIALNSIELITPISHIYATGSSLNTPYEAIESVFKNSSDSEDRSKIIFYISDGEITDESSLKSYKELSKYINGGAVLGYGTTQGGYMKYKYKYSNSEEKYIMYYSSEGYNKAVSKIDESNLKKIANDLKIDYIKMNTQDNIYKKVNDIKNRNNLKVNTIDKSSYTDIYYIFIIPLLILIILDFYKIRRKFV